VTPLDISHALPQLIFMATLWRHTIEHPHFRDEKTEAREVIIGPWSWVAEPGLRSLTLRAFLLFPGIERRCWGGVEGRGHTGILKLTLPGHEVNLDLCKRRRNKWHQGKDWVQPQGLLAPTTPSHPYTPTPLHPGTSSPMKWSLADRLQAKPSGTKL
jgi:hypothetical protein